MIWIQNLPLFAPLSPQNPATNSGRSTPSPCSANSSSSSASCKMRILHRKKRGAARFSVKVVGYGSLRLQIARSGDPPGGDTCADGGSHGYAFSARDSWPRRLRPADDGVHFVGRYHAKREEDAALSLFPGRR